MNTPLKLIGIAMLICIRVLPGIAQFTQQGSKLVGTGAVGYAKQGNSVSLSADGNTAISGAYDDNGSIGAAWVFTRSGGVWTQQGGKLVGSGNVGASFQGWSVDLSADGNTAIVGGYWDNSQAGAAWVFTRSGGVWTQQGSKLVGTGAVGKAWQGRSVALSGDGNTAVVGGYRDNADTGAVWVYTRIGGVWTQQGSKLVGTGAADASRQGESVAISADGNTVIVGGDQDDVNSWGAAWVFTRSGGVWTQQGGKLVGTGASGTPFQGSSVSLSADGNTAIVGGRGDNGTMGAAWVYTRSGGVWTQQGSKLVGTGGVGNMYQGRSVSLSADGNMAIVGGHQDNSYAGAAWIFIRSGGVWSQQGGKLVGTGAVGNAWQGFGVALAADGNTAIVGGRTDNAIGAAWVFVSPTNLPVINGISDIANDQGGRVGISWQKSPYDNIYSYPQVISYSIWRALPTNGGLPTTIATRPASIVSDVSRVRRIRFGNVEYAWEWIAEQPAHLLAEYGYAAATLSDSMSGNSGMTLFFVSAETEDPDVFYDSEIDSGYSVDNLAPIPPAGLVANIEPGPEVELSWNSPTDPDVGYYKVYRSTTNGFSPTPGDSIGVSNSTSYTDANPIEGSPSYYRIIAVDIHDNESTPSNETEATVTVSKQFNVSGEWNIVSVPLVMSDYTKTVLFPSASTNAYTFEDGYVAYGILQNGRGYWMKFSSGETISHEGLNRTEDTIDVAEGWNMVGSLNSSIPVSNVGSIPGGIVTSNFYKYDAGYSASTTVDPGSGYWVKVSQAGQLVMTSTANVPASNRIRIEDTGELPPPPPDEVMSEIPDAYTLEQNYPNPFNPVTSISYALPSSEHVMLTIFNTLGQEVVVLVNDVQEAGYKTVSLDASSLPSGVYTYRITAGTFTDVKKMLLLK